VKRVVLSDLVDFPMPRSFSSFSLNQFPSLVYFKAPHIWFEEESLHKIFSSYPPNLTYIKFSHFFNEPVDLLLPSTLKVVLFGNHFNQNVDYLPRSLVKVGFAAGFNKSIDNLPVGLEDIKFKISKFNQTITGLPPNLKRLCIAYPSGAQHHPHLRTLLLPLCPPSLEVLEIHGDIGESPLPPALKYLTVAVYGGKLPDSLIGLRVDVLTNPLFPLPPKLRYLKFGQQEIPPLPPSLTHLILFDLDVKYKLMLKKLPNLTHLSFWGGLKDLHDFAGMNLSSMIVHTKKHIFEIFRRTEVVNFKIIFKNKHGEAVGEDLLEISEINEKTLEIHLEEECKEDDESSSLLWESQLKFGEKKYL